jgi:hypothetical protein
LWFFQSQDVTEVIEKSQRAIVQYFGQTVPNRIGNACELWRPHSFTQRITTHLCFMYFEKIAKSGWVVDGGDVVVHKEWGLCGICPKRMLSLLRNYPNRHDMNATKPKVAKESTQLSMGSLYEAVTTTFVISM